MKIVLDSNCLLASVFRNSPEHWLFEALYTGRFELAITNEILEEYQEMLLRFTNNNTVFCDAVMAQLMLLPNVAQQVPYYHWQLITDDPDDRNVGPQQVRRLRLGGWR